MSQSIKHRTHCPISFALDLIGDKWSLLILRDIIFKDKNKYKDFLNSGESISTNILADRLAQLERAGFINKKDDPTNGKQYLYKPTKMALDLIPVMLEMVRWSGKHDPKTAAPSEFLEELELGTKKMTKKIKGKFERKRNDL